MIMPGDTINVRAFRHLDIEQLRSAKLVTCDLFDTLIFRLCSKPSDVFHEVAIRMIRDGALPNDSDPLEFTSQRIYAENKARRKYATSECTFEDIAYEMAKVCDPETLMRYELQVEKDYCILNEELTTNLIELNQSGKKIGIISDTYHSEKTLYLLLKSVRFPTKILTLILSSSVVQANKATGELFKKALHHFGVPFSQWVHIGDNPVADTFNFQKFGGMPCYIPQRAYLEDILTREKVLKADGDECASLETMRELSARRAVAVEKELKQYFITGASIFGPAMARFGDWCVDQCKRNEIQKVLVCMREAETFLPLLKFAAQSAESALEVLPFYVSRESTCRAFLFPLDFEKLYRLLKAKRQPHSIRQLLTWLKVDPDRYANLLNLDDIDTPLQANSPVILSLSKAIIDSEECYNSLTEVAIKSRDSFLAYFNALCNQGQRVAVVDLGFSGSTQEFIEEILQGVSSNIRVFGMYFSLNKEAAKHSLKGRSVSSYLGKLGMQREMLHVALHPEILEQTLISATGSVLGYKNGQPFQEDFIPQHEQVRRTEAARKGIFEFVKMWHKFKLKLKASGSELSQQAYMAIDRRNAIILQRLFSYPLQSEADAFGKLYHDDNFGSPTGGTICSADDLSYLREIGYDSLLQSKSYWPQGVFHIHDDKYPNSAFYYLYCMDN